MPDPSDFIGRGFAFPMRVDHTGGIAMTSGDHEDIERGIRMVLSTAPGERLMRPTFGCRIWDLMFEPINMTTLQRMRQAVFDALGQWDPRITVTEVEVDAERSVDGEIRFEIAYSIKDTNDTRNLVYPFYVIPREDES